MKKLLLAALMALTIVPAAGQYFQTYKNLDFLIPVYRNERYNSGVRSTTDIKLADPNKYFFTGVGVSYLDTAAMPVPGPVAYKGDRMRYIRNYRNGNVTHNRAYEVSNVGSGKVFNSEANSITEETNPAIVGDYYIAGSVTSSYLTGGAVAPGGSDATWYNINYTGTLNSGFRLDFNGGWSDRAMCVRQSNVPGAVPGTVECGYTSSPGSARTDCYVARRTSGGAIIWAFTYNFDPTVPAGASPDANCRAFSLCEDPATGIIYGVGIIVDNSVIAPQSDGLAFALNSAGVVLWARNYALGTNDRFHSVRFTADGNLIVVGETNPVLAALPPFNTWINKLSAAGGAPLFSNVIAIPVLGGLAPSRGWDIQERINTAGLQEYQIVGAVYSTSAAPSQLWIKASNMGVGLQCNIYSTLGYDNFMGIDYVPSGLFKPGPAMFSSSRITGIPASNSHLNHTYFNGAACVNICPFQPNTLNVFPQHITLPHINGNIFASVAVKAKLFNYQVQTLCTQSVIACGNNARQSVTINQYDNEMKIYPNPANDLINVTLAVNINEEYMAEIIDATGKVVQSEYVVLPEGESEVQFSISHLPQGIYTLRISDGKQQMHKTFVVN